MKNQPTVDWSEPSELKLERPAVMALDPSILPAPIRDWIIDLSYRLSCPIDWIAVGALTSLSMVIGTRCAIRPKALDHWMVVPNLWGAIVGEPGKLKTVAMKKSTACLAALENAAAAGNEQSHKQYDREFAVFKAKEDGLKYKLKRAVEKPNGSTSDLEQQLRELEPPIKPPNVRYIVNDASMQKLQDLRVQSSRD